MSKKKQESPEKQSNIEVVIISPSKKSKKELKGDFMTDSCTVEQKSVMNETISTETSNGNNF